jgi:hypothetical protein
VNLIARLRSPRESERLRATGLLVLLLGIAGAGIYYWREARPATVTIADLQPDYDKSRAREMGRMMGHQGVMMLEWQDALDLPGTQAVIIAVVSALFAAYFFRAAWVLDDEERIRRRTGG